MNQSWQDLIEKLSSRWHNQCLNIYEQSDSIYYLSSLNVPMRCSVRNSSYSGWSFESADELQSLTQISSATLARLQLLIQKDVFPIAMDLFAWVLQCSRAELLAHPLLNDPTKGNKDETGRWSELAVQDFLGHPIEVAYLHYPIARHFQHCRDQHRQIWQNLVTELRTALNAEIPDYAAFNALSYGEQASAINQCLSQLLRPLQTFIEKPAEVEMDMAATFSDVVENFVLSHQRLVQIAGITPDDLSNYLSGRILPKDVPGENWRKYLLHSYSEAVGLLTEDDRSTKFVDRITDYFLTPLQFADDIPEVFTHTRFSRRIFYRCRAEQFIALHDRYRTQKLHSDWNFFQLSRAEARSIVREEVSWRFPGQKIVDALIPTIIDDFVLPRFDWLEALSLTPSIFYDFVLDNASKQDAQMDWFFFFPPFGFDRLSQMRDRSRWYLFVQNLAQKALQPFLFQENLEMPDIPYDCVACSSSRLAASIHSYQSLSQRLTHLQSAHELLSIGACAWVLQTPYSGLRRRPGFPIPTHSNQKYKSLWTVDQLTNFIESNPDQIERMQSELVARRQALNANHRPLWEKIACYCSPPAMQPLQLCDLLDVEQRDIERRLTNGLLNYFSADADLCLAPEFIVFLQEFVLKHHQLFEALGIAPYFVISHCFDINREWKEQWISEYSEDWIHDSNFETWEAFLRLLANIKNSSSPPFVSEVFQRCEDCKSPLCMQQCVFQTSDLDDFESMLETFKEGIAAADLMVFAATRQAGILDWIRYYLARYADLVEVCDVVASGGCDVSDLLVLLLESINHQFDPYPKTNPERRRSLNQIFATRILSLRYLIVVRNAHFLRKVAIQELQSFRDRCEVPIVLCIPAQNDAGEVLTVLPSKAVHELDKLIDDLPNLIATRHCFPLD